jgi:uncharacterized protein (TIGR00730 family)
MSLIRAVTIFGSAVRRGDEHDFKAAYVTAQLLAKSGQKVVSGGGPGIMLAALQGAQSVGGKTAAVYLEPNYATTIASREKAISADEEYTEKNYVDRTKKLMELGDAYVFFNGGTGTISEFTMCWTVARLYFGRHKPLILFGDFWNEIIEAFTRNMLIRDEELRVLKVVTRPESVLSSLEDFGLLAQTRSTHLYLDPTDQEKNLMLG